MGSLFRRREQAPVALITITVMLGMIMAIIDTTIVNVALNTIGGNLGATVDEVARVVEFFAGPMGAFVSGQVLRIDGGGQCWPG